MTENHFYITTPIYYVNDIPHIGHAYTNILSDVIARFEALKGKKVKFLTGTDEHGQKIERTAQNRGITPQELTDIHCKNFYDLTKILNLSNDDFIRTTETRHKDFVVNFWQKLLDNKAIYLSKYSGWYSVRDEAFYAENELENGLAPTGAPVEWVEEDCYFFNLSQWQEKLLKFYEDHPDFVYPKTRYNEVKSFVSSGLHDLSISRTSFSWGVKVPNDEKHIIYVWLDALTNYISALDKNQETEKFWPANIHVLGKDILRFHAVYWPCFLMAANMAIPKKIIAHGWWLNDGQKISKSLGNVIDPAKLIEKYGLDNIRYYLMREVHLGNDGNYADHLLVNRINSELSNNIGNLLQRNCTLLKKYFDNKVIVNELDQKLKKSTGEMIEKYLFYMENHEFSLAIEQILALASLGNLYLENNAPWKLSNSLEEMARILYNILELLAKISIMLKVFMPGKSAEMQKILNIFQNNNDVNCLRKSQLININHQVEEAVIIFPRIEMVK